MTAIEKKISALINAYIGLAQGIPLNDSDIIDNLTEIFKRKELEKYGFGDFVKPYFDCDE